MKSIKLKIINHLIYICSILISFQVFSFDKDISTDQFVIVNSDMFFSKDLLFNYTNHDCVKNNKSYKSISLAQVNKIKAKANAGDSLSQCKMAIISYHNNYHNLYIDWLRKAASQDNFSALLLVQDLLISQSTLNGVQKFKNLNEAKTLISQLMTDKNGAYYGFAHGLNILRKVLLGYDLHSDTVKKLYEQAEKENISLIKLINIAPFLLNDLQNQNQDLTKYTEILSDIKQAKASQVFIKNLSNYLITQIKVINYIKTGKEDKKLEQKLHLDIKNNIKNGYPEQALFMHDYYGNKDNVEQYIYWLNAYIKEPSGNPFIKFHKTMLLSEAAANNDATDLKKDAENMKAELKKQKNVYLSLNNLVRNVIEEKLNETQLESSISKIKNNQNGGEIAKKIIFHAINQYQCITQQSCSQTQSGNFLQLTRNSLSSTGPEDQGQLRFSLNTLFSLGNQYYYVVKNKEKAANMYKVSLSIVLKLKEFAPADSDLDKQLQTLSNLLSKMDL